MNLTKRELEHYHRQIIIPDFAEGKQKKLKESKVFIAGAGGLGSYIAINLAIAGVGEITIVDDDHVDISNLNRQILYSEEDLGKKKVVVAQKKLHLMNSDTKINPIDEKITGENIHDLAKNSEIIVDALDNFETRYILNSCSLDMNIPLVHGAIDGLEGRVTFLMPKKTPCLRCIIPHTPKKKTSPVLGAICGIIGSLQSLEVIKHLTGIGENLKNKLLVFDGKKCDFTEVTLKKNPNCPVCKNRN